MRHHTMADRAIGDLDLALRNGLATPLFPDHRPVAVVRRRGADGEWREVRRFPRFSTHHEERVTPGRGTKIVAVPDPAVLDSEFAFAS